MDFHGLVEWIGKIWAVDEKSAVRIAQGYMNARKERE
jgi:hypothetical protein